MNPYYQKYIKKDRYQSRYNKNKGNYYQRKNYRFQNNNNYYWNNKNYKRANYENIYEEEHNYEKETLENSFSKSTNSNSRKGSFCEICNESNEINKNNDIKDTNNQQKNDIVQKLNLSKNVFKSAYFVPKSFKEKKNLNINKEIGDNKEKEKKKDENIVILAINIKISEEKCIFFELRKYDDMFELVKKVGKENGLEERIIQYLPSIIMKALNSIYGIMNLKLKSEEIEYLNNIREKYL